MVLKVFLNPKFVLYFLFVFLLVSVISCRPRIITPSPEPVRLPIPNKTTPPEITVEPSPTPEDQAPNPRLMASLQLTKQAQTLIQAGEADSAIRILERAVALDPSNGQNYYYLSEAWLLKKNMGQALNFNDLARIHLGSDQNWQKRIIDQHQRIEKQARTAE